MRDSPAFPLEPRLAARSALQRYRVAVAALLVATGATYALRPFVGEFIFFQPFTVAVVIVASVGGFGPGVAITIAGAVVCAYLFVHPFGSIVIAQPADQARLLIYAVTAVLLAFLVDDRNRMVGRLGAQREWWRTALTSVGDAVIVTDADGRIAFMNETSAQLTGWKVDDAVGRALADVFAIVSEAGRQTAEDPVAKVIRTGRIVGLANHTILIRRDGSEVFIDDSAAPVRTDGGRLLGVVFVYRDISAKRAADRALEQQAENLRLQAELLDHAYDAIFARDSRERVIYWNPASEELYGWTAKEAIGRDAHDLLRTQFSTSLDSVRSMLAAEGHWAGELRHMTRDGRQVIVDSRHVRVPGAEGSVRILEINRDVTERKRAEEREALALADAREANRLKDEFLATLSHELRTPLNAIRGWSQMLLGGRLEANAVRRAYETIDRNAQLQTQLIADILDVSRITSGKLRLDVQPADLAAVLGAIIESIRPASEARQLHVALHCETTQAWMLGDADRLQQVFWNLLSNAVKFTPPDGRIDVTLSRAGGSFQVDVEDSGIGIRPEFVPHVFERFTQSDASASRAYGGLGLGLAITRHLVELHGGTVSVRSAGEGQGTTFTVVLPIRAAAAGGRGAVASAATADVPARLLSGVTVLVVDDEQDARDLMMAVLGDAGAEVRAAASAAEGLALLQQQHPAVILSDIGMPGEDGYGFIDRVRALPAEAGGQTPAVALTAYARTEDRLHALSRGYQQHLAKPIVPSDLVATVAALTRRPQPVRRTRN